jgi:putative heme iron utilization protein
MVEFKELARFGPLLAVALSTRIIFAVVGRIGGGVQQNGYTPIQARRLCLGGHA